MKSVNIFFHSVKEVKDFVNIVSNIKGKVTLSAARHSVNEKSLIGIFCLNLSKELKLEIENWEEKHVPLLSQYIV